MATTLNYWPRLDQAPKAYFVAPNGYHVSGATPAVAEILDHLVRRLDAEVEKCVEIHGYRPSNVGINSYVQDTNHASATAIDYNGGRHLYEPNHKAQYAADVYAAIGYDQDQIDKIREIVADINRAAGFTVIRWGGDFGTKHDPSPFRVPGWRDPMHFEIYGSHTGGRAVSAADAVKAAAALAAGLGSAVGKSSYTKQVQRNVGTEPDGIVGPKTKAATKRLQARLKFVGLYDGDLDGIWGPKTQAAYTAFTDGKPGPLTYRLWHHNARLKPHGTATKALIRKVQRDDSKSPSVRAKYKLTGAEIDGVAGHDTWLMIQDLMGFTGRDLDGEDGPQTWEALQRRLLRGKY